MTQATDQTVRPVTRHELRTAVAQPANIRSGNLPRSSHRRWYLGVYHPDLTAQERGVLYHRTAMLSGVPLPGILGLGMTVVCALPLTQVSDLSKGWLWVCLTVVFAAVSISALAVLFRGRKAPGAVRNAFAVNHPGEELWHNATIADSEPAAIAVAERAVALLERHTGKEEAAALHRALYDAAYRRVLVGGLPEVAQLCDDLEGRGPN